MSHRGRTVWIGAVVLAALLGLAWRLTYEDAPASRKAAGDTTPVLVPRTLEGNIDPVAPDVQPIFAAPFEETRPIASAEQRAGDDDDTIEVLVVERETGRPLPLALVKFAPAQTRERSPYDLDDPACREPPRDAGETWTDVRGVIRIPVVSRMRLDGSWSGLRGHLALGRIPARRPVLELSPKREFRARVTTADGTPVPDVPVGFSVGTAGTFQPGPLPRERTGRDGIAAIDLTESIESFRGRHKTKDLSVSAQVELPLPAPVKAIARLDAAPVPTLELILPALGRVVVDVLDEDGRTHLGPASVVLGGASPKHDFMPAPPRQQAHTADGKAAFDVGIGIALRGVVLAEGRDHVVFEMPPVAASDPVALEVRLGDRRSVWTLRALDGQGVPLPRRRIAARFEYQDDRAAPWCTDAATTDDAGWFVLEVSRPPFLASGGLMSLELHDDAGRIAGLARVAIPAGLPPGPRAPEDVRFEPPPVLARGRVVDEEGRPVSRALVGPVSMGFSGSIVFPLRGGLRMQDAITAADGSFLLHGSAGDRVISLHVSRPGFEPLESEVRSSAMPLDLVLRRAR